MQLHRDRSAVKRDIDELAKFGIFSIESEAAPGHGQRKAVRAIADEVELQCVLR